MEAMIMEVVSKFLGAGSEYQYSQTVDSGRHFKLREVPNEGRRLIGKGRTSTFAAQTKQLYKEKSTSLYFEMDFPGSIPRFAILRRTKSCH